MPGVEDPDALKALIGQTARLEFKLVDLTADQAAGRRRAAPRPEARCCRWPTARGKIAVQRRVMVSGEQLIKAKQSFDQNGQPVVSITFNTAGSKRFGRVTQENVGKPFAIILDDKVLSAPNINEPILGGQAQISGNFTVDSANQLAVALAVGQIAGQARRDRGAHGQRRAGQGFDRQGHHRLDRRDAGGDPVHARHLWPLRGLCDRRR